MKAGIGEGLLVLEQPDVEVQNLAFEYKQYQTNPLQRGASASPRASPLFLLPGSPLFLLEQLYPPDPPLRI